MGVQFLSQRTTSAVFSFISMMCSLKLIPFHWDREKKELQKALDPRQRRDFAIHRKIMLSMTLFSILRYIQTANRGPFPLLLRILNIVWIVGYLLTSICLHQLDRKEAEIMQLSNILIRYLKTGQADDHDGQKVNHRDNNNKDQKSTSSSSKNVLDNNISAIIFLGFFQMFLNPVLHLSLLDASPCSPNFLGSVFFSCKGFHRGDIHLLKKLPFIIFEYYIVMVFIYTWFFNWLIVFLGMSWLLMKLQGTRLINPIFVA